MQIDVITSYKRTECGGQSTLRWLIDTARSRQACGPHARQASFPAGTPSLPPVCPYTAVQGKPLSMGMCAVVASAHSVVHFRAYCSDLLGPVGMGRVMVLTRRRRSHHCSSGLHVFPTGPRALWVTVVSRASVAASQPASSQGADLLDWFSTHGHRNGPCRSQNRARADGRNFAEKEVAFYQFFSVPVTRGADFLFWKCSHVCCVHLGKSSVFLTHP